MKAIDELLGIYSINLGELTMKQVRENFSNWEDDFKLDEFIIFYDQEKDQILVGPGVREEQIYLCRKALSRIEPETLDRLLEQHSRLQVPSNRIVAQILMRVVTIRLEKQKTQSKELETIPGSKFISINGDIFQISKIVSVKSRDEAGKFYIEFYITNKRASVKKVFASKLSRDTEFQRIRNVLERVA